MSAKSRASFRAFDIAGLRRDAEDAESATGLCHALNFSATSAPSAPLREQNYVAASAAVGRIA